MAVADSIEVVKDCPMLDVDPTAFNELTITVSVSDESTDLVLAPCSVAATTEGKVTSEPVDGGEMNGFVKVLLPITK